MTTLLYFLIAIPTVLLLVGGLFAAFKAGERSGIAKYGHIEEDENERAENNE